jgi:hypothetical protein
MRNFFWLIKIVWSRDSFVHRLGRALEDAQSGYCKGLSSRSRGGGFMDFCWQNRGVGDLFRR